MVLGLGDSKTVSPSELVGNLLEQFQRLPHLPELPLLPAVHRERQAGGASESRVALAQGLWPTFPGLAGSQAIVEAGGWIIARRKFGTARSLRSSSCAALTSRSSSISSRSVLAWNHCSRRSMVENEFERSRWQRAGAPLKR